MEQGARKWRERERESRWVWERVLKSRQRERERGRRRGRAYNRGPCRRKRKRANKEERTEEKFGGREGGRRAGTVLWKNGEQDERGQATGSLTWTISLKMPVPPRDLGSKTSRGERISSLLHPGSGERPSFPRRREENFHIFHSRGSVLDRRCKEKKDRRRNEAL